MRSIRRCLMSSAFSKTLIDNSRERGHGAQGLRRRRQVGPALTQRLQGLSDDADKVVKAIDADKMRGVVDNAATFSHVAGGELRQLSGADA